MSGTIRVNRIGEQISGHVNGQSYSIAYTAEKYEVMKKMEKLCNEATSITQMQYIVDEFLVLIKENYGDFVETRSPYIKINRVTNKFHLQYNGVLSNKTMPNTFAQSIIKSVEKNIDILPLIKCWVRFLHCPKYSDSKAELFSKYISAPYTNEERVKYLMQKQGLSQQIAHQLSTTSQVAITQEGLIVGYKASLEITDRMYSMLNSSTAKQITEEAGKEVIDDETGMVVYDASQFSEDRVFEPPQQRQDGDAFYCGEYKGHIMRVGKVIKLESWNQVDCNDGASGRPGLHVGGLKYIRGYQSSGTVTHNIFIDPMHVGAIVGLGDGDDGAMRVKQYFMHSTFQGVNKTIYHSSQYAKLTNGEYENMIKNAVDGTIAQLSNV